MLLCWCKERGKPPRSFTISAGMGRSAIFFGHTAPLPAHAHLAYRLDINQWQGQQSVQFVVEGIEEA